MEGLDIGIDLGTSTIIASDSTRSRIIIEPSVVAVHRDNGKILEIGTGVYRMIGRTPEHIEVIRPLKDGVISEYKMAEVLIRHLLKQISPGHLIKPRVTVCVPSGITGVESQAVIDAAVAAGARNVYLIEEPVAAAIGVGIDLSRPNGNLIVDIGGGTCDIAVLSLNGIVCKTSLKVGGMEFDRVLARYIRLKHGLLIGEKTAEEIKMQIGCVYSDCEPSEWEAKGRDILSGLPKKIKVTREEFMEVLSEPAEQIVRAVMGVLERTPPELVADIHTNGIILTGGGALLGGLDRLMEKYTKIETKIAPETLQCVAIGTAKSFEYIGKLYDGFLHTSTYTH